ncbi:MAG: hypothetical protein H0X03_01575 [Nitrosopumilus sp.]|nr:hypothetical protein [Nitrosopumilus sp.]
MSNFIKFDKKFSHCNNIYEILFLSFYIIINIPNSDTKKGNIQIAVKEMFILLIDFKNGLIAKILTIGKNDNKLFIFKIDVSR